MNYRAYAPQPNWWFNADANIGHRPMLVPCSLRLPAPVNQGVRPSEKKPSSHAIKKMKYEEVIIVNTADDTTYLGLGRTKFKHKNCDDLLMNSRRNPVNDTWEISCKCGLKIEFPQAGSAASDISKSRTDGASRNLKTGSYTSQPVTAIKISVEN